jgi:hypothetical protein
MKNLTTFLFLPALALATAPSLSAQTVVPDATEICDKAEAAILREVDPDTIKSVRMTATSQVKGMNMKGKVTFTVAKPMLALRETDYGMMKISDGTDGEVFWEINGPTMPPTVHRGSPRELMRHGYAAALQIPWRKLFDKVELVGEEDVDDHACWKIKMHAEGIAPFVMYYDKQTFLQRKGEFTYVGPDGDQKIHITLWMGDWRETEGVMASYYRKIRLSGMEIELDEDLFELPAPVVKAVAQSRKGEGS